VADSLQGACINIQGEGEKEVGVGPEGDQGLHQASKNIHLPHPDAGKTDGFPQIPEEVQVAGIHPEEKQQGKKNDEAHGPRIMHGVPPRADAPSRAKNSGKVTPEYYIGMTPEGEDFFFLFYVLTILNICIL
jgi:hypothetical protein